MPFLSESAAARELDRIHAAEAEAEARDELTVETEPAETEPTGPAHASVEDEMRYLFG